jgi:hypothetical protein
VATKVLPIILPPDVYSRLAERAATFDRDALQEARWLLRQALGDVPTAGVAHGGDDDPPTPQPAA